MINNPDIVNFTNEMLQFAMVQFEKMFCFFLIRLCFLCCSRDDPVTFPESATLTWNTFENTTLKSEIKSEGRET